jgi:hypothetical protein
MSESLHGSIGERFRKVSDISWHYQSGASSLFDLRRSDLEIMGSTGVQHDITTKIGKTQRDRPADPLPGASDYGDPAVHLEEVAYRHPV